MEEAKVLHVAQHRLEQRMRGRDRFVVWDVGLGAGANALAVIDAVHRVRTRVELWSFDQTLEPLRFALKHAEELEYPVKWSAEIAELLKKGEVEIGNVKWRLEMGDFRERVGGLRGGGADGHPVRPLLAGGKSGNVDTGGLSGSPAAGGRGLHADELLAVHSDKSLAAPCRMVCGPRISDRGKDRDDGGGDAAGGIEGAAQEGLAGAGTAEYGVRTNGRGIDGGKGGGGAGELRPDGRGCGVLRRGLFCGASGRIDPWNAGGCLHVDQEKPRHVIL